MVRLPEGAASGWVRASVAYAVEQTDPANDGSGPGDARLAELGRPPIRYLTEWRIHLAEELLATTALTVAAIALRVGYDSEEAFRRAFKRARELSPRHWRAARSTAPRGGPVLR